MPHAFGCGQPQNLPRPRRKKNNPTRRRNERLWKSVWGGRYSRGHLWKCLLPQSNQREGVANASCLSISAGGTKLGRAKAGGAAPQNSQEWRVWWVSPALDQDTPMRGHGRRIPGLGTLFTGYIHCSGCEFLNLQLSIPPLAILGQKYHHEGVVVVFKKSTWCSAWDLACAQQIGLPRPLSDCLVSSDDITRGVMCPLSSSDPRKVTVWRRSLPGCCRENVRT